MPHSMETGPRQSSKLIRAASRMVPRETREAWLKEWLSEVWHAYFGLLRDGVEEENADRELIWVCRGAFRDAAHLRWEWVRERVTPSKLLASPRSVLIAIAVLLGVSFAATGGLRASRQAVRGLPYPHSENLVVLRRAAMVLGMNASPSLKLVQLWMAHPGKAIEVAPFAWTADGVLLVDRKFFDVLGMKPAAGSGFSGSQKRSEVVLSYDTWRERFGGRRDIAGQTWNVRGSNRVVTGVMPADFWFLGRQVKALAPLDSENAPRYVNVIGRLADRSLKAAAEKEIEDVGRRKFIIHVEATFLQERLRRPLVVGMSAFGAMLLVSLMAAMHARLRPRGRSSPSAWFTWYFLLKTAGLCLVVSLVWAEVVARQRITENGAVEMTSLFYVLALVGALLGAFAWSMIDQKKRCRTCCLPVSQPVTFGTWSSTLLDQPAVEFLCPNGHGSLFEPELNSGPGEAPTWTSFDESWREESLPK